MKAKNFFTALILAILFASSSFAEIAPVQVLQDPRFSPHIPATKLHGASLLPGRYIVAQDTPSRTGGHPIVSPTRLIVEIMPADSEGRYPFRADVHGGTKAEGYITLDLDAEAPVLTSYTRDKSGNYGVLSRVYAVVLQSDVDYAWLMGTVSDGEMAFMFPVSKINFPEGWYLGEWKCEDGTQLTFSGNKLSSNGQEIGTFTVEDDRITVTAPDGSTDTMYAMRNPTSGTLIVTFTSGPNGMGENAAAFVNMSRTPRPSAPQPPAPKPEAPKPSGPEMPTEFPPMPEVAMPSQNVNIEGVWVADYNGHQFVTQFKGSNYYGWIDGQPSEMGIIRIEGSKITGRNNHGVDFTAELELDPSGKRLDMKFPNGNTIHYQKVEQ
ncbi:MAG: hypothetical protein IJG65_08295 [Synergistaceae bacterium]|nr:hypothetical protein [Synergistaceae bacterium]